MRPDARRSFSNCSFVSRYYLFIVFLLLPFFPLISVVGLCAHLLTTIVEFKIERPVLSPLSFLFYFTLDQLFYQLGVWRGCFKNRTFNPVYPRLAFRRPNWRSNSFATSTLNNSISTLSACTFSNRSTLCSKWGILSISKPPLLLFTTIAQKPTGPALPRYHQYYFASPIAKLKNLTLTLNHWNL